MDAKLTLGRVLTSVVASEALPRLERIPEKLTMAVSISDRGIPRPLSGSQGEGGCAFRSMSKAHAIRQHASVRVAEDSTKNPMTRSVRWVDLAMSTAETRSKPRPILWLA